MKKKFFKTIILLILQTGCTLDHHRLFKDGNEKSVYEDESKESKTEIKIQFNDLISKENNKNMYNFESVFLKGFLYKDENKIHFMNKDLNGDYVLFDFNETVGDCNRICITNESSCLELVLDSLKNSNSGSTFVYKVKRIKNDSDPPLTSPSGIRYIYVNPNKGIIKFAEESGVGIRYYTLR